MKFSDFNTQRLQILRCTKYESFRKAEKFVNEHHSYIDWTDRPSRKMYWLCMADGDLVGVFGLSSGFTRPKPMNCVLQEEDISFNEIGNNVVFALNTQIKNAGSRFLSLLRNDAVKWWWYRYGDELKMLQTFILPPRTGALYKADNWFYIGQTKGHAQTTKNIKKSEKHLHDDIIEYTYPSGETKFFLKSYSNTPQKLILIRHINNKKNGKLKKLFSKPQPKMNHDV